MKKVHSITLRHENMLQMFLLIRNIAEEYMQISTT